MRGGGYKGVLLKGLWGVAKYRGPTLPSLAFWTTHPAKQCLESILFSPASYIRLLAPGTNHDGHGGGEEHRDDQDVVLVRRAHPEVRGGIVGVGVGGSGGVSVYGHGAVVGADGEINREGVVGSVCVHCKLLTATTP